jgi:hypothetical protein
VERDTFAEIVYGFLLVIGWTIFLYSIAEFGLFARVLKVPHSSSSGLEMLSRGVFSLFIGLTIVGFSTAYLYRRKCWPVLVVAWVICIAFLLLAFGLVYFLVFVLRL